MTKAEEMNLLGKIAELIASAGTDSYIHDTFAGVVEVCRNNIENDFGDRPVKDLELLRCDYDAEKQMHSETKRQYDEAQNALNEARRDTEGMQKRIADLAEERDTLTECVEGCHAIIDEQDAEIRKLKAEIVKLRMERMTEEQIAELYDKTEGGN